MFHWVEPFMWALCSIIGYGCQLIGFYGLLVFTVIGLVKFNETMIGEENENAVISGESHSK